YVFSGPAMTSNLPRCDVLAPTTRNFTRCSPAIQSEAPYPDFVHAARNLRAVSRPDRRMRRICTQESNRRLLILGALASSRVKTFGFFLANRRLVPLRQYAPRKKNQNSETE